MNQFIEFINNHRTRVLLTLVAITAIALVLIVLRKQTSPSSDSPFSSSPDTSSSSFQKPFRVISTNPKNGDIQVEAGEIEISFTTDNPIVSQNSFAISITPPLPYYWKTVNEYPTTTVIAKVFGGLTTSTTYTVVIKNSEGAPVSTFSFTTASEPGSSSSALMEEEEKKFIQKYQPLFGKVPYVTADFTIDYIEKLTLEITIRNKDVEATKQKALSWIKSQGVDPATHTINYVNNF